MKEQLVDRDILKRKINDYEEMDQIYKDLNDQKELQIYNLE